MLEVKIIWEELSFKKRRTGKIVDKDFKEGEPGLTDWLPKSSDRVLSVNFVDVFPDTSNPVPALRLGY